MPPADRQKFMEELHQGHPGISRVKGLARCFMCWPDMDLDLEKMVSELPSESKIPSHSTTTSLGMATMSLDKATLRLCGIIPWKDVSHNS